MGRVWGVESGDWVLLEYVSGYMQYVYLGRGRGGPGRGRGGRGGPVSKLHSVGEEGEM